MGKILKKVLIILGIIVVLSGIGIGSLWGYYYVHDELPKKEIEIVVQYSPGGSVGEIPGFLSSEMVVIKKSGANGCPKSQPMRVVIENGSRRTLNKISFSISARRKGYSGNLATMFPYHHSDKIIHPGESYELCAAFPMLEERYTNKYRAEELVYGVDWLDYEFAK